MQWLSLLKKGYIFVFLGILFLAFSFVPFYAFFPACVYWEIKPAVANGDELNQNLGFFLGDSFVKLHVYVSGGDNQITSYLMDSSGSILNQGIIDNSGVIYFQVSKSGYYSLHLENDLRLFSENDEQVLVKVYYYLYHDFFLVSGITTLILGLGLVVYHKQRTQHDPAFS